MAFGISAATWAAIGSTAATAAVGVASADQSRHAANVAADQASANADQQTQQFNKLNGKTPDVAAMADQNTQAGKNGPSGTLLTGPSGVDPSKLLLGKSTLLGAATPTAGSSLLGG